MKKSLMITMLLSCCIALSAIAQQPPTPQRSIPVEQPHTPITEITFDITEYDFGMIEQGESVEQIFRLTNTGDQPLVLSNAKGSCGCTVPSWPKEPVLPGETAAIVVKFNSTGKSGKQTKTITITANTDPAQTQLRIKSEIRKQTADPKIPETASNIQMSVFPNPTADRLSLKIEDGNGKSTNIEIFNGKGQMLKRLETSDAANLIEIDTADYGAGTYWLSVQVGDGERVSLPFIVAR